MKRDSLLPSIATNLHDSHADQQDSTCLSQSDGRYRQLQARAVLPACCSPSQLHAAPSSASVSYNAQQSDRSTAQVRPATALASSLIKHRASSPAVPLSPEDCCLCTSKPGLEAACSLAQGQHICCKDCGYVTGDTGGHSLMSSSCRPQAAAEDALQYQRAASPTCLSVASDLSTMPKVPSSFLDELASKRKPSHCHPGSTWQPEHPLLTQVQHASSTAACDSSVDRSMSTGDAPNLAGVADSQLVQSGTACARYQTMVLHQEQPPKQVATDTAARSSLACVNDSQQEAPSYTCSQTEAVSEVSPGDSITGVSQQDACFGVQCAPSTDQQEAQAQPLSSGVHQPADEGSSQRSWQLPMSISEQLQQARLTVTAIPRPACTQPNPAARAAALADSQAVTTAVAEALADSQTVTTAAADVAAISQTGTKAASQQGLQPNVTLSCSAEEEVGGQRSACTAAASTAGPQKQLQSNGSLAQLRAVVEDSHCSIRPHSPAYTDCQLYPASCAESVLTASCHSSPALPVAAQPVASQAPAVLSAASPGTATVSLSALHIVSSVASNVAGVGRHGRDLISSSRTVAANLGHSMFAEEQKSSLCSSSHRTGYTTEPSAVMHRQISPEAHSIHSQQRGQCTADQATETDALQCNWLQQRQQTQAGCSTSSALPSSPGERRILARRYGMDRDETVWGLHDMGSSGSDSEGSVSSESNLRPSSVGRCRVNSGRHSQVVTRLCRHRWKA